MLTKDARERKFIGRNNILKDRNGEIDGVLISALDITERELLKEELEYSKLKLEFFANLSHEFKTPLNLSFSALQMLTLSQDKNYNPEIKYKLRKYTSIIKQNNYRLLKLVDNMLDITKINSNSFRLNIDNHDIVEFIKRMTYSVAAYIENKNRVLEFKSNVKNKEIPCDIFVIERIILNLLSNAIKFTDEGDLISVNLLDKNDYIVIIVKDTGIGIQEDKQKMIFECFRQVDKSFIRRSEGSGMGLAIVKLLVELHGGKIKVRSEVGVFTEFIIRLPIKQLSQVEESTNNYVIKEKSLIDRIDIEFSDVYGL